MPLAGKWRTQVLLLLALAVGSACSRPGGTGPSTLRVAKQVPFHAAGEAQAQPPADSALDVPDQAPNPPNGVPFHDPQSLPAGTLLAVRLKDPISSESLQASNAFEAEIEEPVTADGTILIAPGAAVSGRVEAAQAADTRNGGYLRLTLNSVELSGREMVLKTSSLFVRGRTAVLSPAADGKPPVVRLEAGRRLTFRLSDPVYISGTMASTVH